MNDVTGLTVGVGITVNALFLPPGITSWASARVQPCFWYQPMRLATLINGTSAPTPAGNAGWTVRFAPDVVGTWQVKIQATDSSGLRESAVSTFQCTSSSSHGFIRVSPTDTRYFEFADKTPFIPTVGIHERDVTKFSTIAPAFNLDRVWWQGSDAGPQAPFGLGGQGGLKDWGNGNFAASSVVSPPANHLLIKSLGAGYDTSLNVAPGGYGKTYQWQALVRTIGVTGPANTTGVSGSNYGPTLHCTDNAAGSDIPVNTQWLHGNTPWTWIGGTFVNNFSSGEFRWMKMGMPNATGGTCYIAEASIREVLPGGGLGPELVNHPVPETLQSYCQEDAYNCDQELNAATTNNIYLKVVCFETKDEASSDIQGDGTIGATSADNTYGVVDASTINAQRWYQRAAMRYFAARWGWSPNIHSVEFLNEGDPDNGNHHNGASAFANYIHQINVRPLLATTSCWAGLPTFWSDTTCDYLDVHKYIGPASGDHNLQQGYGMWQLAPTVADAIRGQVLQLVANDVSGGPIFRLSPMPIAVGHTYRIRFWLKGQGLTKTNPNTGQVSQYGEGPGFSASVWNGHTNATATTHYWSSGQLVTAGPQVGTFDWQERVTPTFAITDSTSKYLSIDAETHYTYGTALFDDIRLEDVTNSSNVINIRVPNGTFDECGYIKYDSALLSVDAWEQYVGGGGTLPRPYSMPLIIGEIGLSGDNLYGSPYLGFGYTREEQQLYKDKAGVWLHKLTWGGIAPGGVEPILWWNNAVYAYGLYGSGKAYRAFMSGIPLNNGRYVNANPNCTGGLRAWGQKDLMAGQAYLWIDNPSDTWINVVNGVSIPALTGVVSISGFGTSKAYTVQWWDTHAGTITSTQTINSNASGTLALLVNNLTTDAAVQVSPLPTPSAPTGLGATGGNAQIVLSWTAGAGIGATGYNVKRATVSGGPYTILTTTTGTSYIDSGLPNSTTYYYLVSGVNAAGESGNSNQATAATMTPIYQISAGAENTPHPPFAADEFFSGGNSFSNTPNSVDTSGVVNPAPMSVYQWQRWNDFTYTLPNLTPGASYTVRLHFSENSFSSAGARMFNVTINKSQVLTNFDIFAAAGGEYKAIVREFPATADSLGNITIIFSNGSASIPKLSGLEILH